MQVRKVICALDTGDLEEAQAITKRLAPFVGAFKVGYALTLQYGLDVLDTLREAGANRIFLDLKFHDIPNSVALAVREATKRRVWMMTLHISGGEAMMSAAVEEARAHAEDVGPLLVGVSVLTSLDERALGQLGVNRPLQDHAVELSELALRCGLDGVVCSPHEIAPIRKAIGHQGVIVSPGIRLQQGNFHDQKRVGSAAQALEDGADYLVIGRTLTESENVEATLAELGFEATAA